MKNKIQYVCQECGSVSSKWMGQCLACGKWNTFVEEIETQAKGTHRFDRVSREASKPMPLEAIPLDESHRISVGSSELDRVLGGGLVSAAVILLGGDPGIGKSTLLLQSGAYLSEHCLVLYVTGEESLQQVSLRAHRLGLKPQQFQLLAETNVERILETAKQLNPAVIIIDSIQTVFTEMIQSAPGSVAQVRESASHLVQFAKTTGTILFLVGHVTKEGMLAGPRVLEHMVDTVLYFESTQDSKYRCLRSVKNRFGAVNELGIFAMTEKGLKEVSQPSLIFLSRPNEDVSGSVVLVTWEGTRPLLVELQALVDESPLANPRRLSLGLDGNRLAMLLAVLHRHAGIALFHQDVFVNMVGGIRIVETASDLPLLLAIRSSLKNKPIPKDCVVFGEVGLSGELRPVSRGQERLKEAVKHGFKKAIVPKANISRHSDLTMEIYGASNLSEAIQCLDNL